MQNKEPKLTHKALAWQNLYNNQNSEDRVIARKITSTETNSDLFARAKGTSVSEKIKLCRSAYTNVGLVGNVIDIMVDFALEGLTIVHESDAAERLFNRWAQNANLYDTVEEVLKCLYRDGNVPILTYEAKIEDDALQSMKKVVANKSDSDIFFDDKVQPSLIPYKFKVLNVLNIKDNDQDLFGRKRYYYQFDVNTVKATLKKTDPETLELLRQMRRKLTKEEWEAFTSNGYYPINNLYVIYYKKDPWSDWATPMLWRIIDDLKFKQTLRNMDISIAESIQNTVQIFKIGDVKNGYPPTAAMFTKLSSMLMNPSKSKQFVWDDLISIESDYPNTGQILGADKYAAVRADILAGLGISEVLIGGEGGNYASSFLSCRTLLERLETGRDKILNWISIPLMQITKALRLRRPPVFKFANMSLRDENAEKKMLFELADRNIISYRTLLEKFDEDFDVELKRMQREDKLRERIQDKTPNAIRKLGKFGPTAIESTGGVANNPLLQGPEGDKGGRPEKSPDEPATPQEVERDTAPVGMSSDLRKKINATIENIRKVLISQITEAREAPLNEQELEQIDKITAKVLVRLGDVINATEDNIIAAIFYRTEAPAKLDRCVKQVYKQLLDKFKQKTHKEPSQKQKDSLLSSAWAICTSKLS